VTVDANLLGVGGLVLVALAFDYINGFHDAANSIATVVSTRVLSPGKAVIWAAFFNFAAAFLFGTAVAKTVGAGMVDLSVVTFTVIYAGLLGAIFWDLITWLYGLPTSSSHALFGGYAGAAVAKAGFAAIIVSGWYKTLIFIVVSPLVGLIVGLLVMTAIFWIFRGFRPRRVAPTPTMAPVMVWVELTPTPNCVAMKIATAAPVSAAKPPIGCSLVIFDPMVWMMRQPPVNVPSAIAV